MNYFVIGPSGQEFGPADVTLLRQWVAEGRILPGTTIRDSTTGQTMLASTLPSLFPIPIDGPGVYVPPPGPGQTFSGYPRLAGSDYRSSDLTVAWILTGISFVVGPCICGVAGLVCAIIGMVFARKVTVAGNPAGKGPMILGIVSIAFQVVVTVLGVLALTSFSQ
jgi:hypothetical protein